METPLMEIIEEGQWERLAHFLPKRRGNERVASRVNPLQ
jgi:hypothetical protein